MRWARKLRLRLRSLFRGSQVEQELDEELRGHLEHLVDEYRAGGMAPEDARYAALSKPIAGSCDSSRENHVTASIERGHHRPHYFTSWRSCFLSHFF